MYPPLRLPLLLAPCPHAQKCSLCVPSCWCLGGWEEVAARGVHRERGPGQKAEEVATEPQLPELSTVCASPAYTLPRKRAWSASLVCAGHPGTRSPLLKPWVPHRRAGRRHGWACLGRPILCRRVDAFIRTAAVAVFWTHWAPGVLV